MCPFTQQHTHQHLLPPLESDRCILQIISPSFSLLPPFEGVGSTEIKQHLHAPTNVGIFGAQLRSVANSHGVKGFDERHHAACIQWMLAHTLTHTLTGAHLLSHTHERMQIRMYSLSHTTRTHVLSRSRTRALALSHPLTPSGTKVQGNIISITSCKCTHTFTLSLSCAHAPSFSHTH